MSEKIVILCKKFNFPLDLFIQISNLSKFHEFYKQFPYEINYMKENSIIIINSKYDVKMGNNMKMTQQTLTYDIKSDSLINKTELIKINDKKLEKNQKIIASYNYIKNEDNSTTFFLEIYSFNYKLENNFKNSYTNFHLDYSKFLNYFLNNYQYSNLFIESVLIYRPIEYIYNFLLNYLKDYNLQILLDSEEEKELVNISSANKKTKFSIVKLSDISVYFQIMTLVNEKFNNEKSLFYENLHKNLIKKIKKRIDSKESILLSYK